MCVRVYMHHICVYIHKNVERLVPFGTQFEKSPAVGRQLNARSLALLAVESIGNSKKSPGAIASVDFTPTSTTVLHALKHLRNAQHKFVCYISNVACVCMVVSEVFSARPRDFRARASFVREFLITCLRETRCAPCGKIEQQEHKKD